MQQLRSSKNDRERVWNKYTDNLNVLQEDLSIIMHKIGMVDGYILRRTHELR